MIGEVTEKVLASIADSAGSLPDDYIGSDGLLYCGQCNTRKEREIIWFDGKPKKVPVMCKCRAEEERLKKEQMQKEEEMRSIQRAKAVSYTHLDVYKRQDKDCLEAIGLSPRR